MTSDLNMNHMAGFKIWLNKKGGGVPLGSVDELEMRGPKSTRASRIPRTGKIYSSKKAWGRDESLSEQVTRLVSDCRSRIAWMCVTRLPGSLSESFLQGVLQGCYGRVTGVSGSCRGTKCLQHALKPTLRLAKQSSYT